MVEAVVFGDEIPFSVHAVLRAEAFGVVTMGSVFPIIAVLLSGFLVAARRKSLELDEAPGAAPPPLRRTAP